MFEVIIATALWAAALILGFIAAAFLFVAFRIARADRHAYSANQALFAGDGPFAKLVNSFTGRAAIKDGNVNFHLIHRGLAFNLDTEKFEPQGRPSAEAIRSVNEPIR